MRKKNDEQVLSIVQVFWKMKHFFHSPLLAPKNHEQLKGEKNFSRSRKLPPATLPAPSKSAREHGSLNAGKRVSNAKRDKTSVSTCVKRARTCSSKTPSLKVRVPVLVLKKYIRWCVCLQLEQEEVWPVVGSEVCGWRHYWSGGLVRNWSLGFLVRFVIFQVMQSLRNGNVCASTAFGQRKSSLF